jgi:CHAT domain-containing protein
MSLARTRHAVVLVAIAASAWAAGAADPDAEPGSKAFATAQARLRDAETLRALSAEGQFLYQRDRIKLDGYQYCSQAVALAERGEFRQSIRAASKALHLGQQEGNDDLVAVSKRDLAIAYSYAGDLDRAEEYAREAIQHRAKDSRRVAGPAYKILGDVSVRRGKHDDAIAWYRQALESSSEKFKPLVQISLANAYVAAGDPAKAKALYDQIPSPDDTYLRQMYRRGLGNLALVEGRPAEAQKLFSEAAQESQGTDAAYHRLWAEEGLARSRLALNDREGARKAYAEAARLSESIRARFRSEEFKLGLFGDVQRIFEQAIALSMEAGDVETAWLLSEQSRSRALLDIVRDRVQVVQRGDAASTGAALGTGPVNPSEVRGALREGEAIVEFHSLEDRLFAWVVRRDGLQGRGLPHSRQALEKAVEELRKAIFQRRPSVPALAGRLQDMIIAPLALAPKERLVIVPHGPLHYLPFQALRGSGGYLIEQHPIAIAPSAGLAVQLIRRGGGAVGQLVAFGNPSTDERYALPASEREVQRISTLFPERKVFLHREASKQRFRETAGTGRVLHVASHAEVDAVDPLLSRILLAGEGNDPGFLEAREVYELSLRDTSLVTISACESGLGRIARGDEILGFTRSFLTAGASALMVSLWPVADESTEALMTRFYESLAAGAEAIDAMQAAQLAVLRQQRFSQPFYWAPFNLIGDWRLRVRG